MSLSLARVFYLGDRYHGSQWQPNVRTIQGELIDALHNWSKETHSSQTVQLSGRTDKGVHSLGQLVLIETDMPIDLNRINEFLPEDIVLWATANVADGFKPRYDVLMRHYRYYMPLNETDIDLISMRKAVEFLIGSHDFSNFSKPDGDRETTTTILNVHFQIHQNICVFDIFGTNFLWKLVRKMITLLLEIGAKKYDYTIAKDLIENKRGIKGGITPAPPEGLILIEAAVPFRFEPCKYAIRRIRKEISERSDFMSRMSASLTSLTNDFFFDRRIPF